MEDEIDDLDEKHRQFIAVCELCEIDNHIAAYRWIGNGCPPKDRLALCKAFIAKAVWDFATPRDLMDAVRHRPALRRLCGWETLGEVPSAFAKRLRRTRPKRRFRARSARLQWISVPSKSTKHGGRHVRVRGPLKVAAHLTFGLVVIAAEQLIKLIT